ILDKHTNPQEFDKIFLDKKEFSVQKIKLLISKYSCDCIVIGNGTASNETFELLSQEIELPFIIVNESGASVYSASKIGAEEFKNLDATDRGTISIGRRYIDPLSELIKIPVESIGVGMYQHDVNQKELNEKLSYVVEDVVHSIGVQVNTASKYLLEKVSGLTSRSAQKIYDNRPYSSRNQLKKLLTPKAYEYAIGFLRINNADEELDSTAIHPKDYSIAKKIIKEHIKTYNKNLGIGESVFNFIRESYEKKDEDIRVYEANVQIKKTRNIDDLKEDEIIEGVVRNIMQFGAFVDIGVKQDGLVHISEVANTFVDDINKFLTIGQKVKVKVISIDKEKNKIQLSSKQVNI
ncbi:MAG: S1 RNA-binding domain-containing protein, partial [Nanoarchaeota archaeon]|nr:S1 RNA-binding domain-containing protein [Nanoarchaeota archaeon]